MPSFRLVVLAPPNAQYLKLLKEIPDDVTLTVSNQPEMLLRGPVQDADAIFCGMGQTSLLRDIWPSAKKVRWVHSMSAGVETLLFPELIESEVPVTNARGVFAESLGEFVLTSILYFAKDLRRLIRSQEAARWDQFDCEVLWRQTLGIVGYGEIGRAAARRAKAMGMKVFALRRRPSLSEGDPLVDKSYTLDQRLQLMAACDYVAIAAPLTPETKGLVGEAEIAAMKPTGVLINVGRGPVIDEPALVRALKEKRIRGAALDVFNEEPLPGDHPFWKMDNLLLSPHCADHIEGWLDDAMRFFVENFSRFQQGQELRNVIDKKAGY